MNKLFIGFIVLTAFSISSCTKTILDVNSPNPNAASTSTPQLTTSVALENVGRITQRDFLPFGMWMGYTATNTGFALDANLNSYTLTTQTYNGCWQDFYLNISNWNYVKTQALQSNLPLYVAISDLFQAYDYSCLVDVFNNVPFSDAVLKNGSLLPAYDNGSDVYDSCVALINEALGILNDPGTVTTISSSSDNKSIIVFKGDLPDLTNWIKFGNSLKLRLLLNQSEVSDKQTYIKQQAAQIDPSMLLGALDDVSADPGYIAASGKLSPYYGNFFSAPGQALDNYKIFHANNFALNFYQSVNDPRLSYFYENDVNGGYAGNDFGDENAGSASSLGDASLNATAPSTIISAAEALFDQAEAIQRGWIAGNAKSVYQNAIEASFAYTDATNSGTTAADYTSQDDANVNWDVATDKIKLIVTQKWAALNNIALLTVYNDYRRTGYPNIPVSIYAGHLAHIPYRLLYPQNEYNLNSENVAAQGDINAQTDKVFWDK